MRRTIRALFMGCGIAALFLPSAAAQQMPLRPIAVNAQGNTQRACRDAANEKALSLAWKDAMRSQGVAEQFGQCVREMTDKLIIKIELREASTLGPTSCRVDYGAKLMNRRQFREAARDCTFVSRVVPVGAVFRSDFDGEYNSTLTDQFKSRITQRLSDAGVEMKNLSGFEREFQDLKTSGKCAITGATAPEDQPPPCEIDHETSRSARVAIIDKMNGELRSSNGEFDTWQSCGSLMMLGEYRAILNGNHMHGVLTVDFISVGDYRAEVPPKIELSTQPRMFSGSAVENGQLVLANLAAEAAEKSIKTVSDFVSGYGCGS